MADVHTAMIGLAPMFRVGRIPDPLAPPDWRFASPDGTFDGRFDDPRGRHGVPSRDRYRVLYVSSQPAGAFGETVARFRPSVRILSQAGGANPFWRAGRGVIPRDWRVARRIGATVFFVTRPLVDLAHPETMQALRPTLAPMAARLGLADIDLSAVTGPQRELTQEAALHVYQQMDSAGAPLFGGLRYVSRFNPQWECWAVFVDRSRQRPLKVDAIAADDPHLYDAARLLNLAIEDDRGGVIVPS